MSEEHRVHSVAAVAHRSHASVDPAMPEVVRHLTIALASHVRRLHRDGYPVPREVHELTRLLTHLASTRLEPTFGAHGGEPGHHDRVTDRLLVTKAEAAERLGVSVRTVERLAATGRLPQVHVERSARFRVKDLESYVDGLTDSADGGHDPVGPRASSSAGRRLV